MEAIRRKNASLHIQSAKGKTFGFIPFQGLRIIHPERTTAARHLRNFPCRKG
jgi:uncharacterized protein YukJ